MTCHNVCIVSSPVVIHFTKTFAKWRQSVNFYGNFVVIYYTVNTLQIITFERTEEYAIRLRVNCNSFSLGTSRIISAGIFAKVIVVNVSHLNGDDNAEMDFWWDENGSLDAAFKIRKLKGR